ncbi:MAG TPA: succinate dehydrogenase, cytochrome b556 subunit [Steroidobacteraceae bacterium]|nr:succinate dehydrogenase, cytochrome b556 subunit [Steroidobacteraceae bacterium]
MPDRPLSPHLSVYRFKYTLLSSILNRMTGLGLTAGLLVLAYWLIAVSQGPEAYAKAYVVLSHPLFKLIFAGLAFAFSYHLVAGVRHLVWDTGRGLEKSQSQKSAWLVGAVSVVLTLALIVWACRRMGAP